MPVEIKEIVVRATINSNQGVNKDELQALIQAGIERELPEQLQLVLPSFMQQLLRAVEQAKER